MENEECFELPFDDFRNMLPMFIILKKYLIQRGNYGKQKNVGNLDINNIILYDICRYGIFRPKEVRGSH